MSATRVRPKSLKCADACLEYDERKPGAKHRVTLKLVAKKYGLAPYDLFNFRRGISSARGATQ